MCGIFGSLGFIHNNNYFHGKIKKALNHRGPDDFNHFYDSENNIFLAHARLSVIDLSSNASQPMVDNESGCTIVFNGEIYNYLEIRKELIKAGLKFKSNSDTEVILKGYMLWGVEVLHRLSGMFAFCIVDKKNKILFLARDRMGEKPLYYYKDNKKFIFASELTAILVEPEVKKEINQAELFEYMQNGYTSNKSSILLNIKKLPPAFSMILNFEGVAFFEEYWKLSYFFNNKKKYKSIDEATEKLNELLQQSIKGQLISDVPLGAFLSGGVDSSLIVAGAKLNNANLSTVSAGFKDPRFDEREQAKKVSIKLETDHHEFELNNMTFEQIVNVYSKFDEPFADTSSLPTYYLSKLTKRFATVALSGDGGDELFCGYQTYIADKIYKSTSIVPRILFSKTAYLLNKIPATTGKVDFNFKLKSFMNNADKSFENAHQSWRQIFKAKDASELIQCEEYIKNNFSYNGTNDFYWKEVKNCHYLDQAMYVDLKTWLVNDILYKVDRMSMANSLEVRAPFLDHSLVEFAASLEMNLKLNRFNTKFILKNLLIKKYDLNFRNVSKLGFNAPMSSWISINNKQFLEYLAESKLFKVNKLELLFNDHKKNKCDNSFKLITLLGYAAWNEKITVLCN
jgi:asparagine synthase (glutamine-hydrolysing)